MGTGLNDGEVVGAFPPHPSRLFISPFVGLDTAHIPTRHTPVMPLTLRSSAILFLALVTLGACRRSKPVAPAPAPVAADDSAERARREAEEREAARRRSEEERLRAEREAAERARAAAEAALLAPVYFAYDLSDIDSEARARLEAKIPVLQGNVGVRVRIEGHTDERGSDEYNLALGQRRAVAAKRYLVDRGIADDRVEVTSMGEERPVCTESAEDCWRRNRRSEFTITAGAVSASVSR